MPANRRRPRRTSAAPKRKLRRDLSEDFADDFPEDDDAPAGRRQRWRSAAVSLGPAEDEVGKDGGRRWRCWCWLGLCAGALLLARDMRDARSAVFYPVGVVD